MQFLHYESCNDYLTKYPGITTYSPVVSASSGSLLYSVNTAWYARYGALLYLFIDISITNIGTASGFLRVTAPSGLPPAANATMIGRETAATGWQAFAFWDGTYFNICKYDGSFAGGTNYRYPMYTFYNV